MKTFSDVDLPARPNPRARALPRWAGLLTLSAACAAFWGPSGVSVARAAEPAPVEESDPGEAVRRALSSAMRDAERAMTEALRAGHEVASSFHQGGTPSTLVLPTNGMTPEAVEALTEDLAVMARLLQKTVRPPEPNDRGFLGNWMERGRGAWQGRGLEALYADGFGALFLMSVDFPLVKPMEPARTESAGAVDEAWEQARREVRGGPEGRARELHGAAEWTEDSGRGRRYDAARVEALSESMLDALRHASNLKGLKGSDAVAVTVFGPSAGEVPRGKAKPRAVKGDGGVGEGAPLAKRTRGSMLMFRAQYSDVVDFAAGKLAREEFVKRVEVGAR